jgi:hypothetical protein
MHFIVKIFPENTYQYNTILNTNTKQGDDPIPALILKFIPVKCSANMPPIKANGTFKIVSSASLALPNVMNKIRNMASKHTGTTCAKVALARCWFSNSPFHVKK